MVLKLWDETDIKVLIILSQLRVRNKVIIQFFYWIEKNISSIKQKYTKMKEKLLFCKVANSKESRKQREVKGVLKDYHWKKFWTFSFLSHTERLMVLKTWYRTFWKSLSNSLFDLLQFLKILLCSFILWAEILSFFTTFCLKGFFFEFKNS